MSYGGRTTETMLAELVHHMAELVKAQQQTNELLTQMLRAQQTGR
ncbi:hypothetical protein [Muricoccus radiodurans]